MIPATLPPHMEALRSFQLLFLSLPRRTDTAPGEEGGGDASHSSARRGGRRPAFPFAARCYPPPDLRRRPRPSTCIPPILSTHPTLRCGLFLSTCRLRHLNLARQNCAALRTYQPPPPPPLSPEFTDIDCSRFTCLFVSSQPGTKKHERMTPILCTATMTHVPNRPTGCQLAVTNSACGRPDL